MRSKIKNIIFKVTVITSVIYFSFPILDVHSMSDGQSDISIVNVVEDIEISNLYDNTTFFLGSTIDIEARVTNSNASIKDIQWDLNKRGFIDLKQNGNRAIIKAINIGETEVIARAKDSSNVSRHINLHIKSYPKSGQGESYINDNIVPIMEVGINSKTLYVEVNKSISASSKVAYLENYLRKLAIKGELKVNSITKDAGVYDFYEILVGNSSSYKVCIRVDVNDSSYSAMKNVFTNISMYTPSENGNSENETGGNDNTNTNLNSNGSSNNNEADENKPNIENTNKPSEGNHKEELIEKEEDKLDIENDFKEEITIIDKGAGTEENPLKIEVNKILSLDGKINAIRSLLNRMATDNNIFLTSVSESNDYVAYKIKVAEKSSSNANINNFFIEILVDKNDEESYVSIIEMLNKIEKENDVILASKELDDEEEIKVEKGLIYTGAIIIIFISIGTVITIVHKAKK